MSLSCAICADAAQVAESPLAGCDDTVTLCAVCAAALAGDVTPGPRWRCLGDAIWSEAPGTQIAAYRLLRALRAEPWAAEVLDTLYLDPDVLARAEAGLAEAEAAVEHRDSNGALLAAGDTVVLIKDLAVKGSSMVAKRGTAVRSIRLVRDNAGQIEGRVNDQTIVILTQFVKKSG
ncbi:MAG: PhnA protein [Rhodobacteraceae bacterium]|nr:PhnA protein [Paracoccaceae bacterium]